MFSECKKLSAICSRSRIIDVAECLRVPGMPKESNKACRCRENLREDSSEVKAPPCIDFKKISNPEKIKKRNACCGAMNICNQAKKCI